MSGAPARKADGFGGNVIKNMLNSLAVHPEKTGCWATASSGWDTSCHRGE